MAFRSSGFRGTPWLLAACLVIAVQCQSSSHNFGNGGDLSGGAPTGGFVGDYSGDLSGGAPTGGFVGDISGGASTGGFAGDYSGDLSGGAPPGGEASTAGGAGGAGSAETCGDTELCEPEFLGTDDDCDGEVDEVCDCTPGQAHFCFMGDSAYRGADGCFDGTEICTENSDFGPCVGGVHANEGCFATDLTACHAITALPFASVDLSSGIGDFGTSADPGSEEWTVTCPDNWSACPTPSGADPEHFQPIVSGEYSVTYSRTVGSVPDSCTYPLIVKGPGLRVELSWEHTVGDSVDLDLHLHEPGTTTHWTVKTGSTPDCSWANCLVGSFAIGDATAPSWFGDANPPDATDWYLDPTEENNTCYSAPGGRGDAWEAHAEGCHNPRLELDTILCDGNETDPNDSNFCFPENINMDFPPLDLWTRVGIYYFNNLGHSNTVHPRVKIFCDGSLAADLGPHGYYQPQDPITFDSSTGDDAGTGNRFWSVADVDFTSHDRCVVQPLYGNPTTRTPHFTTGTAANAAFSPAYGPLP